MQTDWKPLAGFGRILGVLAALGIWSVGDAFTQNRGIDPSDVWYKAYQLILEGEAAEKKGNLLMAAAKFKESKPLFDGLAREYPNFYPDLVRFRREQLVDSLTRLRDRMRETNGSHLNAKPNLAVTPPSPEPRVDPGVAAANHGGSLTPLSPEFQPEGAPAVPGGTPNVAVTPPPVDSNGLNLPAWQGQDPNAAPAAAPRNPQAVVRPPGAGVDLTSNQQNLSEIHQSRVQWMQSEIDRLNSRNRNLEADLENRQRYLQQVQVQLAQAQREAAARRNQLQVAKQDPQLKAQAVELERLLNEALAELDRSNQQNQAVLSELQKTRSELEQLQSEKEAVEKERNELVAIVDGGESAAAIKNLMNENRRLRDQLAEAKAMAERLGEENRDKNAEIALLKERIERVDAERKQLLADNRRYESHIAALQTRLRDLGQDLSQEELDNLAAVSPKLIDENELLKEVVMKQLRRQRQIQATKAVLLDGLEKLGDEAADLYALVDDLATGPAMSPEDRKMIRMPGVEELVADTAVESVTGTIIVEGQEPSGDGSGILEVKKIEEELIQIQKAAQLDFRDGRFAEAEANYLKYLEYRPRSVVCLCNLALVKITTKKYAEAQGLLEKAIAHEDTNGRAYYLLGRTHFEQGNLDDALTHLNVGLRHDPKNSRAHNCVGVISSQKGFANRAEEAFVQAVTIDPKYGDAHFNLAVLFATREKPDATKAMDHYQKAVGLGIPRDAAIETFLQKSLFTAAVN